MAARRLSRDGHDHQIAPGVCGWLESPGREMASTDCLMVSGWAFAAGAPIVSLRVTGCGADRPLRYGLRREDVRAAYPDEPAALESGFFAYLEFDVRPAPGTTLQIWATRADGRSLRLFTRPLRSATAARLRLLLSPRAWAGIARAVFRRPAVAATQSAPAGDALSRTSLETFLASGARLPLTGSAAPAVSVIVVVWNRADLTLACLRALTAQSDVDTEVIVVDNASTDETRELLTRVAGATVLRNDANLGFTAGANLGAARARGEFLLFLNNDAELLPGALGQLVGTARRSPDIGAIGGKLVYPDGRLQEAGSIIWSDGSCEGYGRGGDPAAAEYDFERAVDFCSGALLLTPRAVFERLGGFDEAYRPAYYEDADYGVRLWLAGYLVVYQPRAVAIHREFGSEAAAGAAIAMQRERRAIFVSRHAAWLAQQCARDKGALAARSHPHRQPCVIWIDDAAPSARWGAGFPRAAAMLRALTDLGYPITVYATAGRGSSAPSAIEIAGGGPAGLAAFLQARAGHAAAVIVSRPHNMQYLKAAVGADLWALGAPCVYDAEAVYAEREAGRRRLGAQPMTGPEARAALDAELRLTRGCGAVLVVSERERQLFAAAGSVATFVAGHAIEPRPTPRPFEQRRTILFVGAFGADSPNEDAVAFFCRDVLPALRAAGCDAPFVVAGAGIPGHLRALGDASVSWHADAVDLTPVYDAARVFVAPTRFAAGIPLKILEAAASGVPVVATRLVADQLGWTSGSELLAFEDPQECARAIVRLFAEPELWLRLRDGALARVREDYGAGRLRDSLRDALAAATHARTRTAPASRPESAHHPPR